jgi:hypothetical protein
MIVEAEHMAKFVNHDRKQIHSPTNRDPSRRAAEKL